MKPLRVGLYGQNGHQLLHLAKGHPHAEIVRVCALTSEHPWVTPEMKAETFEELISDPNIDLISLCSPVRKEQAAHAIQALKAGKHVYAEKPAALTEAELDEILRIACECGREFREMGGSAMVYPYWEMREIIARGKIGEVVQVFAQKSYPYHDQRPQQEEIDGGLFLQVGIHAARWIEHVTGLKLTSVQGLETTHGNPGSGELRMAASFQGRLSNGALATATLNYLNPHGFGHWGNDHVRVFGTKGMLESTDATTRTRWLVGQENHGEILRTTSNETHFDLLAESLLKGTPMPLTLEEELHPLRVLIRAKATI